jgi:outer membrane receptor for Fe3+-dicitrate
MTKHKVTRPFNTTTADIFKRDGDRVRYIDPVTARVSGWVILSKPKVSTDNGFTPRQVETVKRVKAAHTVETLSRMTKAELQELARARGIKFTTKTTNKALADALSA